MERLSVPFWIISTLFSLGVCAQIPKEKLTERQRQAISIVMEDFHRRDLHHGFHLQRVSEAEETDFPMGVFVQLEFTLRPTSCKKHQWKESGCVPTNSPRLFNCFSCFKFEYETHNVLSDLKDCVLTKFVTPERTADRKEKCKAVKHKKEDGLLLPGSFSFLKSQ